MPTTPNGTTYTVYPFTAGGESAWRAIADNSVGGSSIPAVLFCHGNPGAVSTDADQQFGAGYTTLRNWLIDNGWAYIEGHGAGANWGNTAGRNAYEAMFAATVATWAISKVIVIGRSMGALVGAWLASQSNVVAPYCAGFVSLSGTADLSNRWLTAGTTDRANLETAYGVSGETAFRAAVATFDPLLATLSTWDGRNAIMQWDTSDTTVPYTVNGQAWDTKYGPRLTLRCTQSTTGGDHNSTPNDATHTAATISFVQDAQLAQGYWSDTWSDTWGGANIDVTATGSLVLSGTATRSIDTSRDSGGMLILSGSASRVVNVETVAIGELGITGAGTRSINSTHTATGELAASGTGMLETGGIVRVATGTLTLSGDAARTIQTTRTALGMLAFLAMASHANNTDTNATGTLALTGVGVVSGAETVFPVMLTLEADIPTLELTATVPQLTLEATW